MITSSALEYDYSMVTCSNPFKTIEGFTRLFALGAQWN